MDVVPNHVSDQHAWFREALASPPGLTRARAFLVPVRHRPGRRAPPNNWQSIFGGPPGRGAGEGSDEWYLHLFAPEQPDLNWTHPEVWAEHEDVLRFWFDRGVAGVRIDSAALLRQAPGARRGDRRTALRASIPITDRDELHDIYRCWRAIADDYPEPRVLVGEVWLPTRSGSPATCDRTSCTPRSTSTSSRAPGTVLEMRASIESALASHAPVDAPATWVLSNHDVTRPVTRYGRDDTSFSFATKREGTSTDLERGDAPRPGRRAARDGAPGLALRLPG